MAVDNATIIDSIWLNGSNDYQQRVPRATQSNITETANALFDINQPNLYNEFVNKLITLVGTQIIHSKQWTNPLSQFKIGIGNGQTIQEIGTHLIKAKGYDLEDSNIFNVDRPDSEVCYHSINRKDRYDITVNREELQRAFLGGNLQEYVASILGLARTSDAADEYNIMLQLFEEYRSKYGFTQVHLDESLETGSDRNNKLFIEKVRALRSRFKILSANYNIAGIPTFTNPEDLYLFVTPEAKAHIDVQTLASTVWNLPFGEVDSKIVEISSFGNTSTQAILVDRAWFLCGDVVNLFTQFDNPKSLNTNYYLHRWGAYGASPFVNAIEFTTAPVSNPTVVAVDVNTLTLDVVDEFGSSISSGATGDARYVVATTLGSVTPTHEGVTDNASGVTYTITDPNGTVLPANGKVYVSRTGKLIVRKSAIAGDYLIEATATYVNPSIDAGATNTITNSINYTVTV